MFFILNFNFNFSKKQIVIIEIWEWLAKKPQPKNYNGSGMERLKICTLAHKIDINDTKLTLHIKFVSKPIVLYYVQQHWKKHINAIFVPIRHYSNLG